MSIRIPYETFWSLSPYEFEIIFNGYVDEQKRQNRMNWINGIYTLSALQSAIGTMFGKKGSQPVKYMEEPVPIYEEQETSKELTEEQKVQEQQKLMLWLESMQSAFEANKSNNKEQEQES